MTSYLGATVTQEYADAFSKQLAQIKYSPVPDSTRYEVRIGHHVTRFGIGLYDAILTPPVIVEEVMKCKEMRGKEFITIDEFARLSESQVAYLIRKHGIKLVSNYESPKNQHKPKHVPPFWASDWRKK